MSIDSILKFINNNNNSDINDINLLSHIIIPSYLYNCNVIQYNIKSIIDKKYINDNKLEINDNSGLNNRILKKFNTIQFISTDVNNFDPIINVVKNIKSSKK